MLMDLDDAAEGPPSELFAEICIVGAGAVGIPLAVKLARAGKDVILLESGGVRLEPQSQELSRGASVGHRFHNLETGRYRVLGGTTSFWGGQLAEFDPIVFEKRPWVSDAEWPISERDIAPYYDEAYTLLGLGDAIRNDDEVWRRINREAPELGNALDLVLTRWTPTRNLARCFHADIRDSTKLKVVVHATATQLSTREGEITQLAAASIKGRRLLVNAKTYILACGTVEISRLLLSEASRRGDMAPWAANKWVGRCFMDHIATIAGDVKIIDRDGFHNATDSIFVGKHRYYPKIRARNNLLRESKMVEVSGQFQFDSEFSAHIENMKLFLASLREGGGAKNWRSMPGHALGVARITLPLVTRYLKDRRSFKPVGATAKLEVYAEQLPKFESSVGISTTNLDRLGMPTPILDWHIDGSEVRSIAKFASVLRDALLQRGLAEITLDPLLVEEDPRFLSTGHDTVHQMSGARMACGPDEGVVDADLRVFSTDNLFIAGAAVFPTAGFANPTFTAIALGLRLADKLLEQ